MLLGLMWSSRGLLYEVMNLRFQENWKCLEEPIDYCFQQKVPLLRTQVDVKKEHFFLNTLPLYRGAFPFSMKVKTNNFIWFEIPTTMFIHTGDLWDVLPCRVGSKWPMYWRSLLFPAQSSAALIIWRKPVITYHSANCCVSEDLNRQPV